MKASEVPSSTLPRRVKIGIRTEGFQTLPALIVTTHSEISGQGIPSPLLVETSKIGDCLVTFQETTSEGPGDIVDSRRPPICAGTPSDAAGLSQRGSRPDGRVMLRRMPSARYQEPLRGMYVCSVQGGIKPHTHWTIVEGLGRR